MKKGVAAFALFLALAACAERTVPPVVPASLDYGSLGRISLSAQDIMIIDNSNISKDSFASPQVSWMLKPTLSEALNDWAASRIRAGGGSGHATVVIKEAKVFTQNLPISLGPDHVIKRQQAAKLVATADIAVKAESNDGSMGIATANATHFVTLPEDPTDAEKRSAYMRLLDGLIRGLDQAADQAIHEHMGRFILSEARGISPQPMMTATQPYQGQPAAQAVPVPVVTPQASSSRPVFQYDGGGSTMGGLSADYSYPKGR